MYIKVCRLNIYLISPFFLHVIKKARSFRSKQLCGIFFKNKLSDLKIVMSKRGHSYGEDLGQENYESTKKFKSDSVSISQSQRPTFLPHINSDLVKSLNLVTKYLGIEDGVSNECIHLVNKLGDNSNPSESLSVFEWTTTLLFAIELLNLINTTKKLPHSGEFSRLFFRFKLGSRQFQSNKKYTLLT